MWSPDQRTRHSVSRALQMYSYSCTVKVKRDSHLAHSKLIISEWCVVYYEQTHVTWAKLER
jgi:hypothetical protein